MMKAFQSFVECSSDLLVFKIWLALTAVLDRSFQIMSNQLISLQFISYLTQKHLKDNQEKQKAHVQHEMMSCGSSTPVRQITMPGVNQNTPNRPLPKYGPQLYILIWVNIPCEIMTLKWSTLFPRYDPQPSHNATYQPRADQIRTHSNGSHSWLSVLPWTDSQWITLSTLSRIIFNVKYWSEFVATWKLPNIVLNSGRVMFHCSWDLFGCLRWINLLKIEEINRHRKQLISSKGLPLRKPVKKKQQKNKKNSGKTSGTIEKHEKGDMKKISPASWLLVAL